MEKSSEWLHQPLLLLKVVKESVLGRACTATWESRGKCHLCPYVLFHSGPSMGPVPLSVCASGTWRKLVPSRHHQYFSKSRLPQLLCSLNLGTGTKPHNICEHSQLINPAEISDIEYSLGNGSQSIHKCKQHNLLPPKPPTSYKVIHSINTTKKIQPRKPQKQ